MKWFYIIAAVVVVGLALTPFLLLPAQKLDYSGKVVTYGSYGAKIRSLDPATAGDTMSAAVQGSIYESLYAYHYLLRPARDHIIPQLAQAMPEISADKLTYTFKLKSGVKYCRNECFGREPDGRPATRTVRAEDFVLAFKRIADYNIATPMSLAFIEDRFEGLSEYRDKTRGYAPGDFSRYDLPFSGVRALDELTLQVKLKTPFPQLLDVLCINNYAPFPHETIDYYLARKNGGPLIPLEQRTPVIQPVNFHAAVGTGAFHLTQFVDGGTIIFERNPDFRHETYPTQGEPADQANGLLADAGKAVPFVDVIYWTYVPEENPAWMLFLTKQADRSGIPRQVYNQVITPFKSLSAGFQHEGIRLITYADPAIYWFMCNMDDPVLGHSKSLRQALNLCFNVEDYIEVLHNGRARRAVNVVPSTFEGHKEAGPSPYCRFDLQAARLKVSDAQKELQAARVIPPGAAIPALTLDLGGREEDDRRMGEFAQQQLRQIGLELKIELNDWPTLQAKVENKQVQMYSMGWHADYDDPENFLQLYYGPNIERGTNNSNYSNPRFDRLYEQAGKMARGDPERTKVYAQMIRILNEDCPALLLTEPISFVLVHPWVSDVKPHPLGYGFGKYQKIDPAMRRRMGGR